MDHLVAAAERYKELLAIFRQAGKELIGCSLKHLLCACESVNASERPYLNMGCTTYVEGTWSVVIASTIASRQDTSVSYTVQ